MHRAHYSPPTRVSSSAPVEGAAAPPGPPLPPAPVAPISLTRFQRMLVGTDGTVTHILAAYADEAIDVEKLLQVVDTSSEEAGLHLPAGSPILRRRVVLRGRRTGRTLLYAEATVALDRVDQAFLDGLESTDKPIGILLAEHRTETFREILEVRHEPAGTLGTHFGVAPTAELISRTYRIVAQQQPIILITEKFPADAFRGLPA